MKMRSSCKPTSVLNVTATGLSHICITRSIGPVTQGFLSLVHVSSTHIQVYVEPANLLINAFKHNSHFSQTNHCSKNSARGFGLGNEGFTGLATTRFNATGITDKYTNCLCFEHYLSV